MFRDKKIDHIIKATVSLLLAASLVAGCGSSEEIKKKKKKIIKKVVIVQNDENTDSSSSESTDDVYYDDDDNSDNGNSSDDDTVQRDKRPRSVKDTNSGTKTDEKSEITVNSVKWDGPDGYTVVYPGGNAEMKKAAEKIQSYFAEKSGKKLTVSDDGAAAGKKEILVGNTNRRKSALKENEYAVSLKADKVYIEGGHDAMTETAAEWFVSLKYESGKLNTLKGGCEDFKSQVKNGYKYVWGDEFGGNALNMSKWCFENKMAGTSMMPLMRDSNVVNVNNGLLKMTAIRYYNPALPTAEYATNSSICTQNTMSYKYGYLEMRAMVPYSVGAWPSFWLVSGGALKDESSKHDYGVEIDVFEIFSSTDTAIPNIHKWFHNGKHTMYNGNHYNKTTTTNYVFKNTDNLSKEYHTYGFEWTPEKMVMSVDGEDYMTFDMTDDFDKNGGMDGFNSPLLIILNNFIYAPDLGETNASNRVNNSDLPFNYFVDYIRLYQKPGVGALNLAG